MEIRYFVIKKVLLSTSATTHKDNFFDIFLQSWLEAEFLNPYHHLKNFTHTHILNFFQKKLAKKKVPIRLSAKTFSLRRWIQNTFNTPGHLSHPVKKKLRRT